MFSSISKAVAHVWSSSHPKEKSSDESSGTDTRSEGTETPLSYPCYSSSYDGNVQPQYGQDTAPSNTQTSYPKSVQFQVGDGTDDSHKSVAEQSYTTSTINGKITHVYGDYGLIDNSIHFRFDAVLYNMTPKVGLSVEATIESGEHEDVGLRATEVVISKADWEDGEGGTEEPEWHIGKVTKTERTSGWLDDTLFYDQDACPYGFLPHRGDWLIAEMTRNVETEAKVVKTVRPLREKRFKGFVTHVFPGYGFIDGTIFFSRRSCELNYVPQRDDQVEGNAIESDQSKGKWRAVLVSLKKQERMVLTKQFPAHSFQEGERMTKENGIAVTVSGEFSRMCIGQEKRVTVYVRNTGEETQKLIRAEAVCLLSDLNLAIDGGGEGVEKTPGLSCCNQSTEIKSGSKISLTVAVTARSVGKSACQIVLTFDTCSISRPIPITVQVSNETLQTSGRLSGKEKWMKEFAITSSGKGPAVLPGVRLARTSNPNLPVKLAMYPVSKRLKEGYAEKRDITEIIPQLKEALSLENYSTYFSALLHIEELKMEVDMREFDIERASMRPRGEFLSLEVPGLAEGRPSVLVGDKVILTEPYASQNSTRYEGFVHEVHGEDVLLKFHPHFHDSYGAELFSVMFTISRTPLRRCHQAAEYATINLGKEVLFPSELRAKSPQVEITFAIIQRSVVYPGRPRTIIKLPTPKNIQRHVLSETSATKESSQPQGTLKSTIENSTGSTESDASQDIRLARKPSGGDKDSEEPKFIVPNALLDGVATTSEMTESGEGDDKAEFFNNKLNARQRSAVMRILKGEGRPTPYILFGPPGTGKTITVVETILQIHHHLPSSRILACTPSNSAADLLAERLHQSGAVKKIDMVRLNSFRRSDVNIPECILQYCSNGEELQAVGHHRIIISTCSTGGSFYSLGLKPGHFTHVIIDEAGQATEPEALVGLGLAAGPDGQAVLAGDPMQLGPVLASSQAGELGLEQSLLERMMKRDMYQRDSKTFRDHGGYNPLLVTKLVNNYRSHPALLKLPSQCFYHDELNACASIEMREMACAWDKLPNKNGLPILFHGIQGADLKEGNSPSWCNPAEAVQAVSYLQDLLSCSELNLKETDIGIITPYRKQVDKLNLLLDSVDILDTKVGSVEEFQGQERPVIIISTVRSSSSLMAFDLRHQLGFLSNPKRFNVSITRPQALLIVVGNPHLLVNDYYWRALLKYCLKNSAYVGCEPPSEEMMKRLDGQQGEEKEEDEGEGIQDVAEIEHPIQPKEDEEVVEKPMQITGVPKTSEQVQEDSLAKGIGEVGKDEASSPVEHVSSEHKVSVTGEESNVRRADSHLEDSVERLVDGGDDGDIVQSVIQERADVLNTEASNSSDTVSDVPACSSPVVEVKHVKRDLEQGEVVVSKEEKKATEIWDIYDSDASEVTSSTPWCPMEEDVPNVDGSTDPSRGWYDTTGDPLPDHVIINSDISSAGSDQRVQEIYPSNTIHPEKSAIPDDVPCMPLIGSGYEIDKRRNGRTRSEGGHPPRRGGKVDYRPLKEEPPRERKKLILQKRTQPIEQSPNKAASASSIFGGAKPVDTASRERDITERVEKDRRQFGPEHMGARVRQDSGRSGGREGRNYHSSSGSDREWSRPVTQRRESERSNEEEVFYKDDHVSVSPNPRSGRVSQQGDVRNRNSQRASTSSSKKSPRRYQDNQRHYQDSQRHVPWRETERQVPSKTSPQDHEQSCVRDHVKSVTDRTSVSSMKEDSDEETGEDFSASSWASGHHNSNPEKRGHSLNSGMNTRFQVATTVPVQPSANNFRDNDSKINSTGKSQGQQISSSQFSPSSNNSRGTGDFVKYVSRGRGLVASASAFAEPNVGKKGPGPKSPRSPQGVAQQAKGSPPIASNAGFQNAERDQYRSYPSPGFGRGFHKPRQMPEEHSPGYQEGFRGNGRGFSGGRGRDRGRGRGRGLLATNFNFGQ